MKFDLFSGIRKRRGKGKRGEGGKQSWPGRGMVTEKEKKECMAGRWTRGGEYKGNGTLMLDVQEKRIKSWTQTWYYGPRREGKIGLAGGLKISAGGNDMTM